MTAFLLGWVPELRYFTLDPMTLEIKKRLTEVPADMNNPILGDVAAVYDKGVLVHTAVFVGARWGWLGAGKWLHQIGWDYPVRLDNFQDMRDSYEGSLRIYR